MTLHISVTDDQLGQYYRRTNAIADRLGKSLPFEKVMTALQCIHDGQFDKTIGQSFVVWKTIKLGTGLITADHFRKALWKIGKVGKYGDDILGNPSFAASPQKKKAELVTVSVAELGFNNGEMRVNVYKRAQELGLYLCPPEVGPQLRLQYKDQPKDAWLIIGMEPIMDSHKDPRVFTIGSNKDGLCLAANRNNFFYGDFRLVFLRSNLVL